MRLVFPVEEMHQALEGSLSARHGMEHHFILQNLPGLGDGEAFRRKRRKQIREGADSGMTIVARWDLLLSLGFVGFLIDCIDLGDELFWTRGLL